VKDSHRLEQQYSRILCKDCILLFFAILSFGVTSFYYVVLSVNLSKKHAECAFPIHENQSLGEGNIGAYSRTDVGNQCIRLWTWTQILSGLGIGISVFLDIILNFSIIISIWRGHLNIKICASNVVAGLIFFLVFFIARVTAIVPCFFHHKISSIDHVMEIIYQLCWGITSTLFLTNVFVILKNFDRKITRLLERTNNLQDHKQTKLIQYLNNEYDQLRDELANLQSIHSIVSVPVMIVIGDILYWGLSIALLIIGPIAFPVSLVSDTLYVCSVTACLAVCAMITTHYQALATKLLQILRQIQRCSINQSIRYTSDLESCKHGGFLICGFLIDIKGLISLIIGVTTVVFALVAFIVKDLVQLQ